MLNYFEVLGLAQGFAIDQDKLESNYLSLQQKFHPDISSSIFNQKMSSTINSAYQALKDPIARLEHILELNGVKPASLPQDFILEQFELNEKLSENKDNTQKLQTEITSKINNIYQELLTIDFNNSDWQQVASISLQKLKFYNRALSKKL